MSKCYRERALPVPMAVSAQVIQHLGERPHALREATNAIGEVLSPVHELLTDIHG
jgi:hypothetical protein